MHLQGNCKQCIIIQNTFKLFPLLNQIFLALSICLLLYILFAICCTINQPQNVVAQSNSKLISPWFCGQQFCLSSKVKFFCWSCLGSLICLLALMCHQEMGGRRWPVTVLMVVVSFPQVPLLQQVSYPQDG